jgi:hypothetical protein
MSPLNVLYNRGAEARVQEELAKALLDPKYAQGLLASQTGRNPMLGRLADGGYQALLGMAAPGYLAYSAQQ